MDNHSFKFSVKDLKHEFALCEQKYNPKPKLCNTITTIAYARPQSIHLVNQSSLMDPRSWKQKIRMHHNLQKASTTDSYCVEADHFAYSASRAIPPLSKNDLEIIFTIDCVAHATKIAKKPRIHCHVTQKKKFDTLKQQKIASMTVPPIANTPLTAL